MLNPGEKAPDFSATTDEGTTFTLSDALKGSPVVLYFYPKDDTPGCTAEACSFRDHWSDLKSLGGRVIGVSSDSTESHRKFKAKYNLPFTLLSDPDGRIRKLYKATGLLIPPRITYVIGQDGIIKKSFNSQLQPKQHVEISLESLKNMATK
ncbi:MAG TPA: peroxiredoxin [Thermoplasmataceae archaeon]|nr:peroxiredoxin [Thermoplasmatales archaeon AK]HLH86670.1 peroxiredoxin [Thermoplasmataceae archaeon]